MKGAFILVIAAMMSSSCATFAPLLGPSDPTPSTPEQWRTYVKRWGHTSEVAVRTHLERTWGCSGGELVVHPEGTTSLVDEDGARSPAILWSALGCGKDGTYAVSCPTTGLSLPAPGPGEVACTVRHRRVVAQGMPAIVSDVGGVVIVKDHAGTRRDAHVPVDDAPPPVTSSSSPASPSR